MDGQTGLQRQVDDRRQQCRREGDKQAVRKTVWKAITGKRGLSVLYHANVYVWGMFKYEVTCQHEGYRTAISEQASDSHAYMLGCYTVSLSINCLDSKPTPSCTESQAGTGRQVLVFKLHTTGSVVCTPS